MNKKDTLSFKIIISSIIFIVLLIVFISCAIKGFFQQPAEIDSENVKSISLRISSIFASVNVVDLEVSINSADSIKRITQVENLLYIKRGVNRFKKATIWGVRIIYHMKNGANITRMYKGQADYLKFREIFTQIPEISQELGKLTS